MYPVLWNVRIHRSGESAGVTELTYILMGEGRNATQCNKQKQNAINKNIRVENVCRSQCYHQTKTEKKMTSLGEDVEKLKPLRPVGGNVRRNSRPLWKTVTVPQKYKIQSPYDPAIPLLGIYLKQMKEGTQKGI